MLQITVENLHGQREDILCSNGICSIGKKENNDIVISSWRVAGVHAEIRRSANGLVLQDLGSLAGTKVNQKRVMEYGPLDPGDEISIGQYRMWAKDMAGHQNNALSPEPQKKPQAPFIVNTLAPIAPGHNIMVTASDSFLSIDYSHTFQWRQMIHDRLLKKLDLRRKDVSRMSDEDLRKETDALIREIMQECAKDLPAELNHEDLIVNVLNEAVGLGPLEKLLADDTITEIMVNCADEIFIERSGRLERCPVAFTSDRAVLGVIERIVSPLGRRIDESSPMVDARLKDGSRVNAIIPPLALRGPCLTIRKFSKRRYGSEDMLSFGSLTADMVKFLQICVEHRKNIIIAGGTGAGKTTLLNVLSNFIPQHERIVTIEDSAELQINHLNLVPLEARPPNAEGRGQVTIRDLLKNSLRMRPDRIVVGECRSGETLDMLQAMNTGHDGSLTTVHANTPRDVLSRLEVMVLMAGMDLPVTAIREQIASAVNIIVQQSRFSCGARKVTHITEITGVESGKIQLQDIFLYRQSGTDEEGRVIGKFIGCDVVPLFYENLARIGVPVDLSIFSPQFEDV